VEGEGEGKGKRRGGRGEERGRGGEVVCRRGGEVIDWGVGGDGIRNDIGGSKESGRGLCGGVIPYSYLGEISKNSFGFFLVFRSYGR